MAPSVFTKQVTDHADLYSTEFVDIYATPYNWTPEREPKSTWCVAWGLPNAIFAAVFVKVLRWTEHQLTLIVVLTNLKRNASRPKNDFDELL